MQLRRNANQPNASLQDFIHAGKLADIVRAVQDIAGFTPSQNIFKVPSLALKIGHSIKKCATIVKATALESGDKQTVDWQRSTTTSLDCLILSGRRTLLDLHKEHYTTESVTSLKHSRQVRTL